MHPQFRRIGNQTEPDRLLNKFSTTPLRESFVEIGEDNFVLPIYYQDRRDELEQFRVRDDDVIVAGHQKSGTTWLQEMVFMILNDMTPAAFDAPLDQRTANLETSMLFDCKKAFGTIEVEQIFNAIPRLNQQPSPRTMRTHLNWALLPQQIRTGVKNPKIVYIYRNPKDVCVSLYYHSKSVDGFRGGFEDFCTLFMAGRVVCGPYIASLKSYLREKQRSNLLFLTYDELKKDLPGVIQKVAAFLNKTLTDQQIATLTEHLSFESMKKSMGPSIDGYIRMLNRFYDTEVETSFFRVGESGNHTSLMSPELIRTFDKWIEDNAKELEISF